MEKNINSSRVKTLNEKLKSVDDGSIGFRSIEEEMNFFRDCCGCPIKFFCDCVTYEDVKLLLTSKHLCSNSSKVKLCDCNALGTCLGRYHYYFKLLL